MKIQIGEDKFEGIRVYLTPFQVTKVYDFVATHSYSWTMGLVFLRDSVIVDSKRMYTEELRELLEGLEIAPDKNLNKEYYEQKSN